MKDRQRITLANALKAVLLVLTAAAVARWIGFSTDETVTLLGMAVMLAGTIGACRRSNRLR